jgi:cation:H+ antiporter
VLDVGGEPPTDDADTEGARGGLRGKMGELEEEPSERVRALESASMSSLWLRFATFAAVLGGAGFTLAWAGSSIAEQTPLSATSVGVLLTAVATSTPELVTAVAAARAGAIGLAAGDIIGGNVFDTLFVAAADIAQSGSIFAAAGGSAVPLAGLAMLLNSLLLAGLVRQGGGTRNVDAESIAIAGVWSVGVIVLVVAG